MQHYFQHFKIICRTQFAHLFQKEFSRNEITFCFDDRAEALLQKSVEFINRLVPGK